MTPAELTAILARLEGILARVEAVLPPAPPPPDWRATAFRWRKRAGRGYLQAVRHPHSEEPCRNRYAHEPAPGGIRAWMSPRTCKRRGIRGEVLLHTPSMTSSLVRKGNPPGQLVANMNPEITALRGVKPYSGDEGERHEDLR